MTRVRRCRNRVTCMKIRVAFVAAAMALSGAYRAVRPSDWAEGGRRRPASGGAATPAAPETIISAMDGGLIGGSIGSAISESDRRTALAGRIPGPGIHAGGQARWTGQVRTEAVRVIAAQPYRVGSQDCRQYTHTVAVGGQKQISSRNRLPQSRRQLDAADLSFRPWRLADSKRRWFRQSAADARYWQP